jgi:hypothetical protein
MKQIGDQKAVSAVSRLEARLADRSTQPRLLYPEHAIWDLEDSVCALL